MIPYAARAALRGRGRAGACAGRASQPRALWLLAASAVLVCLVFFPQERFRIPGDRPDADRLASAWMGRRPAGPRALDLTESSLR